MLARAEAQERRVVRADEQPLWHDPESGYMRRSVVVVPDFPLELTEIEMPAGARVAFPAASLTFVVQAIWVIEGRLDLVEGLHQHHLNTGDSLTFGPPSDCEFHNPSRKPCRYLVAVVRR